MSRLTVRIVLEHWGYMIRLGIGKNKVPVEYGGWDVI